MWIDKFLPPHSQPGPRHDRKREFPFPAQKPAPILVRRWRTIVDVHGMRYALDVYRFLFAVGTGARRRGASATGSQCRGEASAPPSTQTLKLRFLPKMTAVVVSDRSA